jgi:hypothetical protein
MLRALLRRLSGLRQDRAARRAALAAREHDVRPAARASLPDAADLRRVGLGGQTTGSGAS